MPKKTRKEKILAELRNKKRGTSPEFSFSFVSTQPKNTVSSGEVVGFNPSDIRKTLILGILFISIEIILALNAPKLGW